MLLLDHIYAFFFSGIEILVMIRILVSDFVAGYLRI